MPASYPTSIKVFAAHVDLTEVVYAAHMNDVQLEIVAIETILGVSPQRGFATLDARIAAIETGYSTTTHSHTHTSLSGNTTGDDHTQYVRKDTATTKGDIYVATSPGVISRLGVGANGQVLVADSAQAAGVRWGASSVQTHAALTDLAGGDNGVHDTVYPRLSLLTAKGDVYVRTATGVVRLGVGTNGQVLTAASGAAEGVAWQTPTTGLQLGSTAPTTVTPGDAAAAGNGTTAAPINHVHGMAGFGAVTAQTAFGMAPADGNAATYARSNHGHGTPPIGGAPTASAPGDAGAAGATGVAADIGHRHDRSAEPTMNPMLWALVFG